MDWTKDTPTKTGFYWYREPVSQPSSDEPSITIVEVVICEESFVAELGTEGDKDLGTYKGEWIGPLDLPQ
jgi:hypothetical protein